MLRRALKKYFLAGFAVSLPIFVTLYIAIKLVIIVEDFAGNGLNSFLYKHYRFTVPGLGLVVVLATIMIVGVLSTKLIGIRLLPLIETLLIKIPFLGSIYPSARQLSDYLFGSNKKKVFSKVALVSLGKDSSTIGFITNEDIAVQQEGAGSLISVFVPFAPTPFSGIILFYPKEKVTILDIPIEQGLKCVVSGGVISPFEKKL